MQCDGNTNAWNTRIGAVRQKRLTTARRSRVLDYGDEMRLICPNCDAQYEVDDTLVPVDGREVQCSNCATTWFQPGPNTEKPDAVTFAAPPEEALDEEDVETDAPDENDLSDDASALSAAAALAAARNRQPRKPELSADDLEIINEEVTREATARQAEAQTLETQPDLGLDDADSVERASAARDRITRRRGLDTAPGDDVPADDQDDQIEDEAIHPAPAREEGQTKGELLPDIEELSSTLNDAPPGDENTPEGPSAAVRAARGRRGFRMGFGLALIIFAGLIIAYVRQPDIAERFPALAGPLTQYGVTVDALRIRIDETAQSMVEQINGIIDGVNGS